MKTSRTLLAVLAGASVFIASSMTAAFAQTPVDPSTTPTENTGGWVFSMAQLLFLLGVATVLLLLLKSGSIGFACWAVGAPPTTAVAVGLGLAQAGEFSLVLLNVAHSRGAISESNVANGTAIVAISLILTPSLFRAADRLRPRALRIRPAPWISAMQVSRLVDKAPKAGGHGRQRVATS
jgi:hypothetical protein